MASTDFTNLLKNISVRLPGSLEDVVKLELQSLMNDFCDESNAFVDEITLSIEPGETEYAVESDFGTINRLLCVLDADKRLVAARLVPPLNDEDDYVVRLAIAPAAAATYTANIALVPDSSAEVSTSVPDWIWNRYRVGIMDGLLARMMSQVSKPYTNLALAQAHYRLYRSQVSQAKYEISHRYTFRGQGWAFPQTFATARR